jgi:hypothetical protein
LFCQQYTREKISRIIADKELGEKCTIYNQRRGTSAEKKKHESWKAKNDEKTFNFSDMNASRVPSYILTVATSGAEYSSIQTVVNET